MLYSEAVSQFVIVDAVHENRGHVEGLREGVGKRSILQCICRFRVYHENGCLHIGRARQDSCAERSRKQ